MSAPGVILASGSPRRRELMKLLGIEFSVVGPPDDLREPSRHGVPGDVAVRSAVKKAEAVAAAAAGEIVVGADTIVWTGATAFGKPKDTEEAAAMLSALSGRSHEVVSGIAVAVLRGGDLETRTDVGRAKVTFGELSDDEIRCYIETGEPLDKAGAYGIQGRASVFVERIEGCYFAVVGLPVSRVARLLRQFGVRILGEPANT